MHFMGVKTPRGREPAYADSVERSIHPAADVEAFIRALAETGSAHRA